MSPDGERAPQPPPPPRTFELIVWVHALGRLLGLRRLGLRRLVLRLVVEFGLGRLGLSGVGFGDLGGFGVHACLALFREEGSLFFGRLLRWRLWWGWGVRGGKAKGGGGGRWAGCVRVGWGGAAAAAAAAAAGHRGAAP